MNSSALLAPSVRSVLDEILTIAHRDDDGHIARALDRADLSRVDDLAPGVLDPTLMAELLADAALPVSRQVGTLLYALVRRRPAPLVIEFGTSFGVSTIHLAAAVIDAASTVGTSGRVIATELHPAKAARARANLDAAGVGSVVDLRIGDALETLDDPTLDGIDVVLLDGWKDLYLPVLELLEPRLAPGALVIADDLRIMPAQLVTYLDHVRTPGNGWLSVEVPIDDGLELSTWIGRS